MTEYDISDFPLILLIDSSKIDTTAVALIHQRGSVINEQPVRAQALPELINELLGKQGLTLKNITAIGLLAVEGSLTGLRIGVTTVNTLAWLNDIPMFTYTSPAINQAVEYLESGGRFKISKRLRAN